MKSSLELALVLLLIPDMSDIPSQVVSMSLSYMLYNGMLSDRLRFRFSSKLLPAELLCDRNVSCMSGEDESSWCIVTVVRLFEDTASFFLPLWWCSGGFLCFLDEQCLVFIFLVICLLLRCLFPIGLDTESHSIEGETFSATPKVENLKSSKRPKVFPW